MFSRANVHYQLIADFYHQRRAKRSGVRYMNHIDEGLELLSLLGARAVTKEAFCLHPLVQSDKALRAACAGGGVFSQRSGPPLSAVAIILAMDYRATANGYLAQRRITSMDDIKLSPLLEVQQMLVADKVQNRKDFELHHAGHPNHEGLKRYFSNWLERLGVSEQRYQELIAQL